MSGFYPGYAIHYSGMLEYRLANGQTKIVFKGGAACGRKNWQGTYNIDQVTCRGCLDRIERARRSGKLNTEIAEGRS